VNLNDLIGSVYNGCYFWYKGSDSTPPCYENVERMVM